MSFDGFLTYIRYVIEKEISSIRVYLCFRSGPFSLSTIFDKDPRSNTEGQDFHPSFTASPFHSLCVTYRGRVSRFSRSCVSFRWLRRRESFYDSRRDRKELRRDDDVEVHCLAQWSERRLLLGEDRECPLSARSAARPSDDLPFTLRGRGSKCEEWS